ncbi:MAG: protein translocase SEC61 complex subunit gamma [Candidatus Diapherotrites archaeon]
MSMLSDFIDSSRRIFTVSRKPTMNEFKVMMQVTGLGIIIIGVIGFAITLLFKSTGLGM